MPDVFSFGVDPITCHAWNQDRSQLALSLNSNEVNIYSWSTGEARWILLDTLSEHVERVTGIDWAPNSNRIVTCSSDRNAYVWTQQLINDVLRWKPTLVILRINRSATCVRWSPFENKFAVGSGARLVSVCYFEKDNDWWVSKHIKKPFKSTVTCLDWHPNNVLLACGSTDFKTRVLSAYIKEIDEKPSPCTWGSKMPFANLMAEFSSSAGMSCSARLGGWVHSVSFSANGSRLAWVGHDSSVNVLDGENGVKLLSVKTSNLPFVTLTWVSADSIVAAGHDCGPAMFSYDSRQNLITLVSRFDDTILKQQHGPKFSAMKHFQSLDFRASTVEENDSVLDSLHQNTVTQVSIHSGDKNQCTKVSTSGLDGQLVVWDVKSSMEYSMSAMRI